MIINKASYNGNTDKHVQVSSLYLGHVCICGMNALWHGWTVNLGHLNDRCRLAYHLISHGDQWLAGMAGVKWAASSTMVTGAEHMDGLKKKMARKGGGMDMEMVFSRRCDEVQLSWGCTHTLGCLYIASLDRWGSKKEIVIIHILFEGKS